MRLTTISARGRSISKGPPRALGHHFIFEGLPCSPPIRLSPARLVAALLFSALVMFGASTVASAATVTCRNGALPAQPLQTGEQPDLIVTDGECRVLPSANPYYYGNVNIIHNGRLIFEEKAGQKTNFWTSSIVVEATGYLYAGSYNNEPPFGTNGGILTIYIYGKDQSKGDPGRNPGQGVLCRSEENGFYGPCGIRYESWADNGRTYEPLRGWNYNLSDFFYRYGPLNGDGKCSDGLPWIRKNSKKEDVQCDDRTDKSQPAKVKVGYFGYKTLAVSRDGGLFLRGYKGASYDKAVDADPLSSGVSWIRLADGHSLKAGDNSLTLDRDVGDKWQSGDQIVVTTTDYLPGHSEQLTIDEVRGATITFHPKLQWPHNGARFALNDRLGAAGPSEGRLHLDGELVKNGAETRAAVGLLTRSIRIVSAGDKADETFEQASARTPCPPGSPNAYGCYYFGAHTVVRQGFAFYQVQGVEFSQLGQGGRIGHYPVHFHMARKTPPNNVYVKDSSVNESMTRWYVVHSTQGVTLARNVGYKSIGHGYYLEDGTETDNKLYSNLGIFARSATADDQNPRRVPGILAANEQNGGVLPFPYKTDAAYPTGLWITNGWNDFIGNMMAGAGACGSSYWFVPVVNSDMPDLPTGENVANGMQMKWTDKDGNVSYAGLQINKDNEGASALRTFYKNYATSTMTSFQTTGDVPECNGVFGPYKAIPDHRFPIVAVKSLAPDPAGNYLNDPYYPHARGGNRHATLCPAGRNGDPNCSNVPACSVKDPKNCAVTVLDHFTSSFHWADGNTAAIWLRNQWYLLTDSIVSDVQNGGLTFITGGDYTHSSIIPGYWALVRNSVFIGHTQPQDQDHKYSLDAGPFNALSGLKCDWQLHTDETNRYYPADYCASKAESVSMQLGFGFGVSQRLFSIYDGPAYEDSVAYLDINTSACDVTGPQGAAGCMYGNGQPQAGIRRNLVNKSCFLPNAAIGWKQPNGFFYPPAFHSANLYFNNVDIRHYVINPLFQAPKGVQGTKFDFHQGGTYLTDTTLTDQQYCSHTPTMFNNFSGIDRQTELNDDDGTLTALTNNLVPPTGTISVNQDPYFTAPVEAPECRSNLGIDPATACKVTPVAKETQTARTSPYDYVATAIAPQCSQTPKKGQDYGRCGDGGGSGEGGIWSSECTNQRCYGVPLYRQYLVGDDQKKTGEWTHWFGNECNDPQKQKLAQCRWPFMRMAGQNLYQRETLTANHGTYYLDTAVKIGTQQGEPFSQPPQNDFNLFQEDQTYYMFFLYAKKETHQSYQIYVGKGFNTASMLKAVRGSLANAPVIFSDYKDGSGNPQPHPSWLTTPANPVDGNGVLTVSIDFTGLTELDPSAANLCEPHSFCKAVGNTCRTALAQDGSNSPAVKANKDLWAEADAVCKTWAVKDLDCPAKGCLGFAFTLPHGFKADDQGQAARPSPRPFPAAAKANPNWPQFHQTALPPDSDSKTASDPRSCYYAKLPTDLDPPAPNQCKMPPAQ
jgi:cell migration-inducing and hyaluronan-binding protein